jgi:hypothetical protein
LQPQTLLSGAFFILSRTLNRNEAMADGKRSLVNEIIGKTVLLSITLVANWDAELKKK